MRVTTFTRADEIPPHLWDPVSPEDFFFRRSLLATMEKGNVEEARYRYLVLFDNEAEGARPVGLAVLSAFTLKLDLLSDDPWVRRLRRVCRGMLDVPIVSCGIPASFGQSHFHVVGDEWTGEAVQHVHQYMEAWADEEGRGFLFWKEWNPADRAHAAIRALGYVPLPTLPDHRFRPGRLLRSREARSPAPERLREGDPDPIERFMGALRASYRRKFRAAAALLREPGPPWRSGSLELEEGPLRTEDVYPFYAGYERVMDRTPVRLERYSEGFFHALAESDLDVRLVSLRHHGHGESISALLVPDRDVLTFILVAKDLARYRTALYPLLLRCVVLLGLRGGFLEVRLGQTSGHAKGSVGAETWPLHVLVRGTRRWSRWTLARFGSALFPEVQMPSFRVFRREPGPDPAPSRPGFPAGIPS